MARAVRRFLEAAGLPLQGELIGTPARVAEAWARDFLDGYGTTAAQALGPLLPAAGAGLVCVTGLDFHSTCPHHLLPYRGLAHVAYLPAEGVVGFSRLGRLVDALAHRLLLQEVLAREIAAALESGTGARGAGCVLETEQACLTCRGRARARARTRSEAFVGELERRGELREEFRRAIASGALPFPREVAP
ncbi:MAG TPA: GTP cyclohydrolase I [Myxococcales bacterium]|nr:GTP cyclohydrolase I [Myxococcales bacterium]